MGTRLIQTVTFVNVAPAATVALPHNINVNDIAKKPDFVAADTAGFTIVVTATQVSVTNNNAAPATANVWLELKHTIPRELGAGVQNLTPQPFIASSGVGGGGAVTVPNLSRLMFYQNDFFTDAGVYKVLTGGGAVDLTDVDSGYGFRMQGLMEVFVPNTALSAAQFGIGPTSALDGRLWIQAGFAPLTMEWRFSIDSAPAGGADFEMMFGAPDSPTISPSTSGGLVFACGLALFGNANWWVKTAGGAPVDTGVPVDANQTSYHRYGVVYDPTLVTPDAKFYIDDTLVATITTNLPVADPLGYNLGQGMKVIRVSTAIDVLVDYLEVIYPIDRT